MGSMGTVSSGGLVQALGVGGVLAADYQNSFYFFAEFEKSFLAFICCRTDGIHYGEIMEFIFEKIFYFFKFFRTVGGLA